MDGLFFLMSVVGVGVAMWWVFQNDGVAPDKLGPKGHVRAAAR